MVLTAARRSRREARPWMMFGRPPPPLPAMASHTCWRAPSITSGGATSRNAPSGSRSSSSTCGCFLPFFPGAAAGAAEEAVRKKAVHGCESAAAVAAAATSARNAASPPLRWNVTTTGAEVAETSAAAAVGAAISRPIIVASSDERDLERFASSFCARSTASARAASSSAGTPSERMRALSRASDACIRAIARSPAQKTIRAFPFTFSTATTLNTWSSAVERTCVPPHALRSTPAMSMSRSDACFPRRPRKCFAARIDCRSASPASPPSITDTTTGTLRRITELTSRSSASASSLEISFLSKSMLTVRAESSQETVAAAQSDCATPLATCCAVCCCIRSNRRAQSSSARTGRPTASSRSTTCSTTCVAASDPSFLSTCVTNATSSSSAEKSAPRSEGCPPPTA
mmetsp:Transcript_27932/g.91392  ORF Transcript_27932/g.91392 Transcript_27932/m.91392 type:complete len:403 (-) Transcript_27932:182-1390(-)